MERVRRRRRGRGRGRGCCDLLDDGVKVANVVDLGVIFAHGTQGIPCIPRQQSKANHEGGKSRVTKLCRSLYLDSLLEDLNHLSKNRGESEERIPFGFARKVKEARGRDIARSNGSLLVKGVEMQLVLLARLERSYNRW